MQARPGTTNAACQPQPPCQQPRHDRRQRHAEVAEHAVTNDTPKPTGTTGAPNPKSGSSDAARGLGGHSKDASHKPGSPAEYVEKGVPVKKG